MPTNLPSFQSPPLREMVLSTQFDPIDGFSSGHQGLFWAQIQADYPNAQDAALIDPVPERFTAGIEKRPHRGIQIRPAPTGTRLQLIDSSQSRMIQIQDNRLVFNWRKIGNAEYPRWAVILDEYTRIFKEFEKFLSRHGFTELRVNQWEVTYLNHLIKGAEWNSPNDWNEIVPGLVGNTGVSGDLMQTESLAHRYKFLSTKAQARLHVELVHGFVQDDAENDNEALILKFVARGPAEPSVTPSLADGFNHGHEMIVTAFDALTSAKAHKFWGKYYV